jgi:hypothetical protein
MWQSFISWLVGLFVQKKIEQVAETFSGWIKDEFDARDHIFGETK